MSQSGIINTSSGPVPPAVPTSFVTDSGTAVPVANVLNVLGNDSTSNNANGISTTGSGNTVTVVLSNRAQGTATTIGGVTADVITFSLGAVAGAFKMHFEVVAYESTTPAGLGYSIEASARTDGAAATIIGTPDADEDEDVILTLDADWDVIASGNNVVLRVTGVAGLTLNWNSVMMYVYIG